MLRNLLVRTIKTFVATFIGSVATIAPTMMQAGYENWQTAVITLVCTGVASGVTAVMNLPFIKKFFKDYGEKSERRDE